MWEGYEAPIYQSQLSFEVLHFFSDWREFQIIELDGVAYKPATSHFLDLVSGQRASILVDGLSSAGCKSAYILAFSDPKVSHGTTNCPMTFPKFPFPNNSSSPTGPTFPDWVYGGVQYAHGYCEVPNQPLAKFDVLEPGDKTFSKELLKIWTTDKDQNDPNVQQIQNAIAMQLRKPDNEVPDRFKNRLVFLNYKTHY
jgi:hypothetical protein